MKHEVRDPIYSFIVFDDDDRKLINSWPMQRLKYIRQLAMTYQVYPGAVHTRFEHSLGVMEMACRIFDTIREHMPEELEGRLKPYVENHDWDYWRKVLRYGALLHDVGHLPFSHAGEGLLPSGWDHERLTAEIIRHSEIATILKDGLSVDPEHVVGVCWKLRKRAKVKGEKMPDPWLTILNEIITGDVIGADRMDYLVRDSYHCGVPYGRFGPDRLVREVRLRLSPTDDEPTLALDVSAIHSAEALLMARYFMYKNVYYHDVRRAYDVHLTEFLKQSKLFDSFVLKNSTHLAALMGRTDNEVLAMLRQAQSDSSEEGHIPARRILCRDHYHTVYEWLPIHTQRDAKILDTLKQFCDRYDDQVVFVSKDEPMEQPDLWIIDPYGELRDIRTNSPVMSSIPAITYAFVFASSEIKEDVRREVEKLLPKTSGVPLGKDEEDDQ